MDLGKISFNSNHKLEAAAKDAATGLRLVALAFVASVIAIGLAIFASRSQASSSALAVASFAFSFLAFAAGGYGAYLAAGALDWAGFVTGAIVLAAIIPYLKFLCFIVLAVYSIDLIRNAGYKFSFFGPLRKRVIA